MPRSPTRSFGVRTLRRLALGSFASLALAGGVAAQEITLWSSSARG